MSAAPSFTDDGPDQRAPGLTFPKQTTKTDNPEKSESFPDQT